MEHVSGLADGYAWLSTCFADLCVRLIAPCKCNHSCHTKLASGARRYQSIWLCYLHNSLEAWLQNIDYTQFKRVMQSVLMGHRGDVHPLKRSFKAYLLNNVLGKLNAMLSVL